MSELNEKRNSERAPDEIAFGAEENSVPVDEVAEEKSEEVSTNEEETMIEVHAPHESVHSWKDILIHIGIITVGLLLAIGLEQTVEFFHHRHQVAETREALKNEREVNIHYYASETEEIHRMIPLLRMNLAVYQYLRKHPGAPKSQWPGDIHWFAIYPRYSNAAWKSAQTNDILRYMPQEEVRHLSVLYDRLELLTEANQRAKETKRQMFINTVEEADPAKLSPQQLDEQIRLTAQQIRDYSTCSNEQFNIHAQNQDFAPAPTTHEVYEMVNITLDQHDIDVINDEVKRMHLIDNFNGFDKPTTSPSETGEKK
jgi:hypothetical protein